jgi:hypothetical protein
MKIKSRKCKNTFSFLPIFTIEFFGFYDSIYKYVTITIGWLSRIVVFDIFTWESNKPGFHYEFHLFPEINLSWLTKHYICICFNWLIFDKGFFIKGFKQLNKIKNET